MSPHEIIGITAGVLAFGSAIPYIWDIIGGITKPNTVTYFVWTLLQGIAIAAQLELGASWSIFLLVGTTLNTGIIFLLSLTKYGYKKYSNVDTVALILAGIAILILIFTEHPVLAILLPIVADAIGAVPTVVKTRKYPHTEERFAWFLMIIASALGIVATEKLDFANLAYPSFLLFEAIVIFSLAFFTKRTLVCRWGRGCI
ncbi:MAG: hypothetical protein AAB472_01100 [Patescibacteria group bacterium]